MKTSEVDRNIQESKKCKDGAEEVSTVYNLVKNIVPMLIS